MDPDLVKRIEALAERGGQYRPEAFFWVLRVLEFTRRRLRREGHVTGPELLEGARALAVEEFGPMALEVLRHWGIRSTTDLGRIVFALVDDDLLSKLESDTMEDFTDVYDFQEAFRLEDLW